MSTISIKYCDIPQWLQVGDFYRNLGAEDPERIIKIPAEFFVVDDSSWAPGYHYNPEKFRQLVRIALYWLLDEIPFGIVEFCDRHDPEMWQKELMAVPGAVESKVLAPLLEARPHRGVKVSLEGLTSPDKRERIVQAAKQMEDSSEATAIAAEQGKVLALKCLHEQGIEWSDDTCCNASRDGHLQCLQYAHENGCPWDGEVHKVAAEKGHLHIMQYAYEQGLEWQHEVCILAALNGHLHCLQYAHENGCVCSSEAVLAAAGDGHPACLEYLLEQGCPIHKYACNMACSGGHLHCLRLLHAHHVVWDEVTSAHAAQSSHLSCLQYLHENGCPWDEQTTTKAARVGHLHALRYAIEHHCPCDANILMHAVRGASIECLQYLLEERKLCLDGTVFIPALLRGNLSSLQYLIEQGCPYKSIGFTDAPADVDKYDQMFVEDNPEFTQCVRYAVERGWKADAFFCKYISTRDEHCTAYLRGEELLIEKVKGEDVMKSHTELQTDDVIYIPPRSAEFAFKNMCVFC